MKWPRASAKHRKGIAESLTQVTMALFATDRGAPPDAAVRRALGTQSHPMDRVSWTAPKNTDEVDRQVVANPTQARALLAAVDAAMPELTAFFGCMY
jgi:hypothetical protein